MVAITLINDDRFDDMRQRGSCYSVSDYSYTNSLAAAPHPSLPPSIQESETAGIVNTVILRNEEISLQLQ